MSPAQAATAAGRARASMLADSDQRTRILGIALDLMSARGAQTMSMRQLAAACGLNVATLYHYFPSKAALLQAVLEDKRYIEQLAVSVFEADPTEPPPVRLAAMVRWLLEHIIDEEATWRLMLGEALRGEQVALDAVHDLSAAITDTVDRWVRDSFPELHGDVEVAARAIRDQLLAFCVEGMALDEADRLRRIEQRATDVAALLFPDRS